ncbi:hypothetical protein [Peribacillus asahii]|nr:hypothetical protein [Peribacillus asahii]USK58296.1 hypothetical protein LIT37_13605 [Peribacillus asahii]
MNKIMIKLYLKATNSTSFIKVFGEEKEKEKVEHLKVANEENLCYILVSI